MLGYGLALILAFMTLIPYLIYQWMSIPEEKLNEPYMTFGEFGDVIIPIGIGIMGLLVLSN